MEIAVNGHKFECANLDMDETETIFDLDIAEENLLLLKKVFDKNQVPFLLMYGTLLGAVRDHNFIKHDRDADISVLDEEALLSIIPDILSVGFECIRCMPRHTYTFMKNKQYIDVYPINKESGFLGRFYCTICGAYVSKSFFESPRAIPFLGTSFLAPYPVEKILIFWYGRTWRVPIKNKPGKEEAYMLRFFRNLVSSLFGKKTKWLKAILK